MKVERERLIAYMRILIVLFAVVSVFVAFLNRTSWQPESEKSLIVGSIAALIYCIVILFLIGRIDKRYLYYFSWLIDLFFVILLIWGTKGLIRNPYVLLFLYLIFSYGLGRSLYQNVICATIISIVYGALTFSCHPEKEEMGNNLMNLSFSLIMFYVFGLAVYIVSKAEIARENKIEHQEPGQLKQEEEPPPVPADGKVKVSAITWQIPKTLEEAYSIIKDMKKERDEWEKKYLEERQKNNTIRQIAHDVATQKELFSLYENIVNAVRREINSQAGFLMRLERSRLVVKFYDGSVSEITMKAFESSGLFSSLLGSGNPVRMGINDQDTLSGALAGTHDKIRSLLCVPLKTQYDKNPFGLIGLANYQEGDYSESHEEFLRLIAIEAAVAIKNIEYIQDIERKYDELILGLARAIEAKDDYTHDHVDRVRELSEKLARALGLSEDEVRIVKTAATLHDVGKIATPDHILKKKGALDEMEWQQMKMHTIKSRDILEGISSLEREVLNMVLLHHERHDGKGYPKGLKADEIPMGAKIIAVADTFDAMTSDRPYKRGFSEDVALEKMKSECMGTQFDPDVLNAFLKMMSKRVISKRVREKSKRSDFLKGTDVMTPGDTSASDVLSIDVSLRDISVKDVSRRIPPEQLEKPRKILDIDFTKKE